ncbi:hypothetical protein Glove_410g114 [Diversispora epigaea]|uniref:Uncharacterized protein n=1 Tax=Diversispora epigaea TaxID=1348612 RepID=A0A397H602_9GLOM|nr:hypothetical protein Glove_410g114 [Diversispora epigaea]
MLPSSTSHNPSNNIIDTKKLHRSETRGVADYQVRLFIALIIASPIIVSAGRATYSSFSHSDDAVTKLPIIKIFSDSPPHQNSIGKLFYQQIFLNSGTDRMTL